MSFSMLLRCGGAPAIGSFGSGAEDMVLRGGRGAGNCVVGRHVRA